MKFHDISVPFYLLTRGFNWELELNMKVAQSPYERKARGEAHYGHFFDYGLERPKIGQKLRKNVFIKISLAQAIWP